MDKARLTEVCKIFFYEIISKMFYNVGFASMYIMYVNPKYL